MRIENLTKKNEQVDEGRKLKFSKKDSSGRSFGLREGGWEVAGISHPKTAKSLFYNGKNSQTLNPKDHFQNVTRFNENTEERVVVA